MKQFLTILLCGILLIGAAAGAFALVLDHFGMGDVTGITKKVKNPNNLIDVSMYNFKSGNIFEGVTITYDADGVMTLNGQATADTTVFLGEYVLNPNTAYMVSVYCPEPARTTTGTKVMTLSSYSEPGGAVLGQGSFADNYSFSNSKLQYCRFFLTIQEGDAFEDYTVAPVMVPGKSIQPFYINETITLN